MTKNPHSVWRTRYIKVFLAGSGLAVLLWLTALLFLNPPQCPMSYTQQQIDASNCVVGANIGLGMVLMAAMATEVVTIVVAAILFVTRKK